MAPPGTELLRFVGLLVFGTISLAGLGCLVSWIVQRIRGLLRRRPRILVARDPIMTSRRGFDYPQGICSINGVEVRDGDTIVLTRQGNRLNNGIWLAKASSWERPRREHCNSPGTWIIADSGELWICNTTPGQWERVESEVQLLPFSSPDIVPSDPAEAAAYLLRLGINPSQVRWDRVGCIRELVADRFLTHDQGEMLLVKPENLTTEVLDPTGVLFRLSEQSWSGQVVAHMNSIRSTYQRLIAGEVERVLGGGQILLTAFTDRESFGPKKIKKNPQRISRYKRTPVI
jgi:hypothetical protein